MIDQQRGILRSSIWSEVERTIDARIDRCLSVNHQRLIGNHHFAHASHECLLLYRDGYFTSCIMVAQAVSDGILEFIRDRNSVKQAEKERKQALAERMGQSGILSEAFVEAFGRIQRSYRNDLQHMNPPVARLNLESFANHNIADLAAIEREIFECGFGPGGTIVPKNPRYWDLQPDGSVCAYVRGQ